RPRDAAATSQSARVRLARTRQTACNARSGRGRCTLVRRSTRPMDANRLTEKSQQALQEAQTLAVRFGHQEVDGEHLLLALVQQEDGIVPKLLTKAEADVDSLVLE